MKGQPELTMEPLLVGRTSLEGSSVGRTGNPPKGLSDGVTGRKGAGEVGCEERGPVGG